MRRMGMLSMRALSTLVVVALVGTACGDDDSDGVARPVINVGVAGAVETLDPQAFPSTSAYAVTRALYEPLVVPLTYDSGGVWITGDAEDATILGAGAENGSLEPTEDFGWIWTFNLRRDAEFASGEDVSAGDYEYAFRRALEGSPTAREFLSLMGITAADQVTVVDDHTLRIETAVQSTLMQRFITFPVFSAIDAEAVEEGAAADDPWGAALLGGRAAGSGAYRLADLAPDTRVVLEPNPGYWDAANLANSGVVINVVPDPDQRAEMIRTGELDVALDLPPRLLADLAAEANLRVHGFPSTGLHYMAVNVDLVPSLELRKAILAAVPYEALLDEVMQGYATPAAGVVTQAMETHDPAVGSGYSTDLDAARSHLEASGQTGVALALGVRESRAEDRAAAQIVKESLAEIGVEVTVEVVADAEWAARADAGEFHLVIDDWFSWGEDPFYQMRALTTCDSPFNRSGFCNQTYDQLVETGMSLFELESTVGLDGEEWERTEFSSEAQQILLDFAAVVPLWSAFRTAVTGACVTGLEIDWTNVPSFRRLTKTETC